MIVDELHGLFKARYAHDAQHGTENLFLVNAHFRRHAVEQASTQEEAMFVVGYLKPTTIDD
ncbi:hypothetical protein D3C84_677240 [compost metagenome]